MDAGFVPVIILFWILAALMCVAAAALVVWPLWRGGPAGTSRQAANVAIYRERTAELRAEVEAGRLPPAAAQSLEAELGRRLLTDTDTDTDEGAPIRSGRRPWFTSAALALLVPGLAGGIYLATGDWRLAGSGPPDLAYMAQRLADRTAAQPDNAEAWLLLGRAREGLGEYASAAQAFARVNALIQPPRADLLALEAQARALASEGALDDGAAALFEQALAQDPENGQALWYLGLAAAQAGQTERARRLWGRLTEQDLPAEFRRLVETRLAALRQESR